MNGVPEWMICVPPPEYPARIISRAESALGAIHPPATLGGRSLSVIIGVDGGPVSDRQPQRLLPLLSEGSARPARGLGSAQVDVLLPGERRRAVTQAQERVPARGLAGSTVWRSLAMAGDVEVENGKTRRSAGDADVIGVQPPPHLDEVGR